MACLPGLHILSRMRRERALAVDDSQAAGDRFFECPLVVSFFEVMATQIFFGIFTL